MTASSSPLSTSQIPYNTTEHVRLINFIFRRFPFTAIPAILDAASWWKTTKGASEDGAFVGWGVDIIIYNSIIYDKRFI